MYLMLIAVSKFFPPNLLSLSSLNLFLFTNFLPSYWQHILFYCTLVIIDAKSLSV